ncbi:MAG: zinc carboxypeptidase [Elusimicrobia bacterium]|nr:zinc carboxypeptidase [Elusimicrobiota bacterium]
MRRPAWLRLGWLFAACLGAAQVPGPGPLRPVDARRWVAVGAETTAARSRASAAGLAVEEIFPGYVTGVIAGDDLPRLRAAGLTVLREAPLEDHLKAFPPRDKAYHDYAGVVAELRAVAESSGGGASLLSAGKSFGGRDIPAIRFNADAAGDAPSAKPGLLLVGTHHAREHLSTETPLLLARWLVEHRGDAAVKKVLETRDVFIVPILNPDGSEYDIETGTYRAHRKNTRPNGDNTIGVDLNRNYESHWCESGASRHPGSETFCGPAAFSEPESRALRDFVAARGNLRTMVSFHTFGESILYPWSWGSERIADARALEAYVAMAKRMSEWTGYSYKQSAELYPSSGDTCDWAWDARKIFCFTFELGPRSSSDGGFYPGPDLIAPTVAKNALVLLYLAEAAGDPYVAR